MLERLSSYNHESAQHDFSGNYHESQAFQPLDHIFPFMSALEAIAPDLKLDHENVDSKHLSFLYAESFINKITSEYDPQNLGEFKKAAIEEYHNLGREVFGPIAAHYVDTTLSQCDPEGRTIFLARDATPFYRVAKTFQRLDPKTYPHNLEESYLNRKLCGIEDEQEKGDLSNFDDSTVAQYVEQHGFAEKQPINLVEVGAWGTIIQKLKIKYPQADMQAFFFYTHIPQYIYGYSNLTAGETVPPYDLEAIADSWEAFPKAITRPTRLLKQNDRIAVDFAGTDTTAVYPFLADFTKASLSGIEDAAVDFIYGKKINPQDELVRLAKLSHAARDYAFTGILPQSTPLWSGGEDHVKNWSVGKIPPLRDTIR